MRTWKFRGGNISRAKNGDDDGIISIPMDA
jgi:hypothetical protein